MWKNYFFLIFIFLNLIACSDDKAEQFKEGIRLNDNNIVFYGKVVNSEGLPLKGAKIIAEYMHFSRLSPIFTSVSKTETETNEKGLFTIEGIVGCNLTISEIQLKDYWSGKKNKSSFGSFEYNKQDLAKFMPDKNRPVIFELQKIIYDCYILERDRNNSLIIEQGAKENFYLEFLSGYNTNKEPDFYDFKIECAYIDGKFTLQFLKKNDMDKVIVSENEKLSKDDFEKLEATNKIEILKTPNIIQNEKHFKYLFVKNQDCLYYARYKFEITLMDTRTNISYESSINPYGEFQFEGYPQRLLKTGWYSKIQKVHSRSLKEGKLANKADFRKLLEQMAEEPKK